MKTHGEMIKSLVDLSAVMGDVRRDADYVDSIVQDTKPLKEGDWMETMLDAKGTLEGMSLKIREAVNALDDAIDEAEKEA